MTPIARYAVAPWWNRVLHACTRSAGWPLGGARSAKSGRLAASPLSHDALEPLLTSGTNGACLCHVPLLCLPSCARPATRFLIHFDLLAGEAFRAACGLSLGYFLRPFFKVEQLLSPVYNWGLGLFFPNVSYQVRA